MDESGPIPGEKGVFIKNSAIGNFGVLICADYLDSELRREIRRLEPDILFLVSLNNRTDEFFALINGNIVECSREYGRCPLVVYCNSIYRLRRNGQEAIFGDGKSSLWGWVDKLLIQRLKESGYKPNDAFDWKLAQINDEGVLVAEVNLEKIRRGPSPHTIGEKGFGIRNLKTIALEGR